jgi:hypothetical protein
MDSQETPINRRERRRSRRSIAAERVSLWFEEWVRWRGGDALRALFDFIRRPFEWAAWAIRRGLVWPLQDRTVNLGTALAALAAVLVIAVGVAAVLGSSSGPSESEPASEQVAVAPEPDPAPAPRAAEKDDTATLQGAAPIFEPAKQEKAAAPKASAEPAASVPVDPDPATATIGSGPGAATSSAATASDSTQSAIGVDGPPAGAKAIAVAEDFAGAFVLYETGGEESKVRRAFAATATPELAKSLLKRPPRLPANVEVPKAKVVNVVAGPSHGGIYTVSVSLLRVGLTSELRLDMEKLKKDWVVTNVLG